MMQWIAAAISLALLSACESTKLDEPVATEFPQSRTEFVEIRLDGFSSPFTRETVIKLNEIVARSLAVIQEYDGSIKNIRLADDSSGGEGIVQLKQLSSRAKAAREDFAIAEAELRSSGEKYNDAILAGMAAFVVKVDDELRAAVEDLEAQRAVD